MPHRKALHLGTGPRSVQEARRWVVDVCERIGRDDLAECAELAVSELVTNAVLHGEPPIWLQVRGTPAHPRIEVHDASVVPPQPGSPGGGIDLGALDLGGPDALDGIDLSALNAFGRGLDIVARASVLWGALVEEDGKTVWFEPAAEFAEVDGAPYQLDAPASTRSNGTGGGDRITVRVRGLPVAEFTQFQRHYRELRREVRLLALAHEDDYPLAKSLAEYFNALERPLRDGMGREQVDTALRAGRATVDLDLRMERYVAEQIGNLTELLDIADDFARGARLLTIERGTEQRAFQEWFLGEFARQARGESPVTWARRGRTGHGSGSGGNTSTLLS